MTPITGKRKRPASPKEPKPSKVNKIEESSSEDEEQLKAIFQRAFEAKFKPLPEKKAAPEPIEVEESEEDNEDDWEGFSEDESAAVQIVEYGTGEHGVTTTRKEATAFLSSKVPISASAPAPKSTTAKPEEEEEGESLNLKNDLALQRLLSESHLLDSTSTSSLAPTGKNRLKALDLRMQSLGAKASVYTAGKMPMHMRKGMVAKRAGMEEKRRREAKENGIVLEKEKRLGKFTGKRERGVGGPSVGKYRGGALVLTKRDVRSIEMSGDRERRKGGKKARR